MGENNPHSGPKTKIEWFKYFLYNDPDFLRPAKRFMRWFEKSLSENDRIVIGLTACKEDPLKLKLKSILGQCDGVKIIEETATLFEIPEHVVEYGFIKHTNFRSISSGRTPIIYGPKSKAVNIESNELVIKIFPNTRWEDLEENWKVIKHMQKELIGYKPHLKTSSKYELLYAIYKQQLRSNPEGHKTFPQIFEMYEKGTLPGYSGPRKMNYDESLARFYRRNKPKPDTF